MSAGTIDEAGETPDLTPLPVRIDRVNGLIGTSLDASTMAEHLASIGFDAEPNGDGSELQVTIPSWRRWDTETETDVAEEVARMYGFENIERTVPRPETIGELSDYQLARRAIRSALVGAGCDEIQPLPFLGPGDLSAAGLPEDGCHPRQPVGARRVRAAHVDVAWPPQGHQLQPVAPQRPGSVVRDGDRVLAAQRRPASP